MHAVEGQELQAREQAENLIKVAYASKVFAGDQIFNAFETNHPIKSKHLREPPSCIKMYLILDQATYVSKLVRQLQVSQNRITEQAQTTAKKLSLKQQVYFLYNLYSIYVIKDAISNVLI